MEGEPIVFDHLTIDEVVEQIAEKAGITLALPRLGRVSGVIGRLRVQASVFHR